MLRIRDRSVLSSISCWRLMLLMLLMLLMRSGGGAAEIQVQITPTHGEISVGESKFFLCEAVGDVKDIDWFDPSGQKILPNRPDIFVSRSDESTSTLTIYHATVDNAGIYVCVAKSGEQEAQATVHVNIFQKITFLNAPAAQEFNEGDDANILCEVSSSPPATIVWKFRGSRIQPAKDVRYRFVDSGLQINGIKKIDEGSYTCEARVVTRGELDLRIIKVVVNVLPSIRARQSEVNATADIGSFAILACDADGFPEPTVTWARNNVVLEAGDKYVLKEEGSELVISDVSKLDEGEYTCFGRNKAGETSTELSLNVFVPPKITYLKNETSSEFQEQVTLTCEATGDPTPSITWSFKDKVFTEGQQSLDGNIVVRSHARVSSLTLKDVQFTYAGQYLCTASNSIAQDQQLVFLEVRYAPKILGSVTAYTWEGNAANISCDVDANPGAAVIWFRDGIQLPTANSSNIRIYNTNPISYLEVTPLSPAEFGSYNCTATNSMGSESKEFLLIQAEVPSSPEILQVKAFSSTALVEFEEPDSLGGVPVLRYRVGWRQTGQSWSFKDFDAEEGMSSVAITGLKPESSYEVKISAINGKGEGESSDASSFQTQPVHFSVTTPTEAPPTIAATTRALREPSEPVLQAKLHSRGNSLKVSWVKQDDGGSPITFYRIKYKATDASAWKPEIRLPQASEHVVLNGLDWDTEYEVQVLAENQQGRSKPGVLIYRTAAEPTTVPDAVGGVSGGLSTGAIVGILMVVFFLLLVAVDVACFFLNKCGLLMCIAVNVCGKTGPGAKSKDMEEGQAAFTKDESKEPIVEVRTEDENAQNQEGGGTTEPNETTPLTEPEPATPPTDTTLASNSVTDSCSPDPPHPCPEAPPSTADPPQPDVGPLVDLSEAPQNQNQSQPGTDPGTETPGQDSHRAASTEPSSTAHTDGKSEAKEENSAPAETEVKSDSTEVKTVPNEAPQTNGNESKA